VNPRQVTALIGAPGVFLHTHRGGPQCDRGFGRALAESDDALGFFFNRGGTQRTVNGDRFPVTIALPVLGGFVATRTGTERNHGGYGGDRCATPTASGPFCGRNCHRSPCV